MERFIVINKCSVLEITSKGLEFMKEKYPNCTIYNKKTNIIVFGQNINKKFVKEMKKNIDKSKGGKYIFDERKNDWYINPNYNWLKKQDIKYVETVNYIY